jgi:hypothetical protein
MADFPRQARHYYQDPLACIWEQCAERVGFRVQRSREVYASCDGRGTLLIATDDQFDPDDNLGQMILHELCHALVEGEAGERTPDWGLDNTRMGRPWREQACLRLQAWLAAQVGLRDFFAPTTDFRVTFWESLPADPFASADGRRERACVAARVGARRAGQPRWAGPLRSALEASARLAACVPRRGTSRTCDALPPLWDTAHPPPPMHPAGHAPVAPYHAGRSCADCAWVHVLRHRQRCRHAPRVALPPDAPACFRYEPAGELDCRTCGACCREAYDSVEISPREPVNGIRPEWIVVEATHRKLKRNGERCVALMGGHQPDEAYACAIHPDRPRTCREFTRGSENCLDARRKVGLSL